MKIQKIGLEPQDLHHHDPEIWCENSSYLPTKFCGIDSLLMRTLTHTHTHTGPIAGMFTFVILRRAQGSAYGQLVLDQEKVCKWYDQGVDNPIDQLASHYLTVKCLQLLVFERFNCWLKHERAPGFTKIRHVTQSLLKSRELFRRWGAGALAEQGRNVGEEDDGGEEDGRQWLHIDTGILVLYQWHFQINMIVANGINQ